MKLSYAMKEYKRLDGDSAKNFNFGILFDARVAVSNFDDVVYISVVSSLE